jgi:hypothetical protein
MRGEARVLAAVAVLLIAVRELQPLQFADSASPFHWIPFTGFLGATRDAAIRVSSEKFFVYGATVWMIREAGLSMAVAGGGVSALLFAGEWIQRYLPGRVAESTDAVLAATAAFVMVWLTESTSGGGARPPQPRRRDG